MAAQLRSTGCLLAARHFRLRQERQLAETDEEPWGEWISPSAAGEQSSQDPRQD